FFLLASTVRYLKQQPFWLFVYVQLNSALAHEFSPAMCGGCVSVVIA
ncbi:hypothetical protein H180DRAFT_04707, partial [Streptomyces sp. WMMB 322]